MNRFHRSFRRAAVGISLGSLILLWTPVQGEEWTLDQALKQIDRATKGVKGIGGEVTITDKRAGEDSTDKSGKVAIMDDGQIRVDITGDDEMTIICNRTEMYLYEPKRSLVHEYKLSKHPDKLAQYALLGFTPRGSGIMLPLLRFR